MERNAFKKLKAMLEDCDHAQLMHVHALSRDMMRATFFTDLAMRAADLGLTTDDILASLDSKKRRASPGAVAHELDRDEIKAKALRSIKNRGGECGSRVICIDILGKHASSTQRKYLIDVLAEMVESGELIGGHIGKFKSYTLPSQQPAQESA